MNELQLFLRDLIVLVLAIPAVYGTMLVLCHRFGAFWDVLSSAMGWRLKALILAAWLLLFLGTMYWDPNGTIS